MSHFAPHIVSLRPNNKNRKPHCKVKKLQLELSWPRISTFGFNLIYIIINKNTTVTYLNRANNRLKAMHSEGKCFVWIGIPFVFLFVC